jgi:hypothetical protein
MPSANDNSSVPLALARRLAAKYISVPQVEAVALAGSRTSRFNDARSDTDLYVYVTAPVELAVRAQIAAGADEAEIGNQRWEPGDEWIDRETGIAVDVMFRHIRWIEDQIDRVLKQHQASVGYSTCFWYNVLHSELLYDRSDWFTRLKQSCKTPYPDELKQAIIAKNYPLLRHAQSSYLHQIELAFARNDRISVNHRTAALLASYFDVLFAINELPHPGEKRLVHHVTTHCAKIPLRFVEDVEGLIGAIGTNDTNVVSYANALADGLDQLMRREHLLPPNPEVAERY